MKKILLIAIICSLNSCASLNPSNVMESWVGETYSNLLLKWGPPTKTFSDGKQGQIVIYEFDRNFGERPGRIYKNGDGWSYTAPKDNSYTAKRMFWVNTKGIIYNWKWEGF